MDFDDAVAIHSKWKRKLREHLTKGKCSMSAEEVGLDHKCVTGKWIYGEGAMYADLPEYTQLKYAHARFHRAAADLIQRANSGESIGEDAVPCSNSEFSKASSAIIMALMKMKKLTRA